MLRSRVALIAVVALPALLLAGVGVTHPQDLTDGTAGSWRNLHVLLLPVFPLLALAPWLVTRLHNPVLGWIAALLGYVYAACYTALDVLAGIGAGALQAENGGGGKLVLFAQGNGLADYGVWAYLLATVLASAVALRAAGLAAVPGSVLVLLGALLFLDNHIYWPEGVLSMLALALGWAGLAWVTAGRQRGAGRTEARARRRGAARPEAPEPSAEESGLRRFHG